MVRGWGVERGGWYGFSALVSGVILWVVGVALAFIRHAFDTCKMRDR
jgi:hypothetical protein